MSDDVFEYDGWRFEITSRVFTLDVRDPVNHGWRVSCNVTDPRGVTTVVEMLFDCGWNHRPDAEDVRIKMYRHTGAKL